jgi:hypothetical protein
MSEFDPGHNYDDGYGESDDAGCAGFTSAENLRDKALFLFGRFLEKVSKREVSPEITPAIQKYLSVDEVALILRDHAEILPDGFRISAESRKELDETLRELMASLMERILSNVLANGVQHGLLECVFDGDVNDFQFLVTEKGAQISDEYERTHRPIED